MKKQIYLTLCFISLGLFYSCQRGEMPSEAEFIPYISAHTGGVIQLSSSVRIELAEEQPGIEPQTEIKEKLFSFTPAIKGKTYWESNRVIEFVPDKDALKSGKTYQAEFHLGKVLKVDKRLKVFRFSFRVEEKKFDVKINSLDIEDPAFASVKGEINFNEPFDTATVKKMFSVSSSDNQSLTPILEAGEDSKTFYFSINNIQRKKEDINLIIKVEGKTIGSDKVISETVEIPALDVFKVLSAEFFTEPDSRIRIVFSDPISKTQDLKGLITLSNYPSVTIQVQDNQVNLFFTPDYATATLTVNVSEDVKNSKGENLGQSFSKTINIEPLKPQIELLRTGTIMPDSENLILPFRTVSLKAVDLRVIRIYESNILMFLQTNTYDDSNDLRRAGRLVYKKTIQLDNESAGDNYRWHNHSIDLSTLFKQEPGAIYRIELSTKRAYSSYPSCENDSLNEDVGSSELTSLAEAVNEPEESGWDYPGNNSYYGNDWWSYDWSNRDNPCDASYYYYSDKAKVSCNLLSSNVGVIAKSNSNNQWWIFVNNLSDTKPIANANVTFYNYQLQPIGTAKTDADGFAYLEPKGIPFIVVAANGAQKTYLRLTDGENNSLSRFDTGGKTIEKGLKGYIYGERGVWRPGDTLHISFILYDTKKQIPENHPVALEIYNARGQFYSKQIQTNGVDGFYVYKVPTKDDDPTGLWNAYVKVGGTSFHKPIRIETIKPNRLKINLKLPGDRINASSKNISATLSSSWLTGVTARNLKAKIEMTLSKTNTQFKGYENYIFNNPATDFSSDKSEILDDVLDNNGEIKFTFNVPEAQNAPGLLNANLVCRVFEQGGDASIYTQSIPFSPFESYVGINLNTSKDKYIETDKNHTFDIVTLDADGKPMNRGNLEYKIYKMGWSWWWEEGNSTFANYINSSSYTPVKQGNLKTVNGKTSFNFQVNYPDWGRFFVYVKDKDSGHATGGTVYMDWPDWRGRADRANPDGVKMLSFSTDKSSYETGEDITVIIPASAGGNALMTLENGSTILKRTRISLAEKGDTKYTFKATADMAPNFYIHITLLQPHAQTANDLPIRMYGVIPVMISNKETVLNPQIKMPDVLRPETEFNIEVSEKNAKPMTYTLAIVDEGLLDLTNFKTPDPWSEFYSREALGIRTWDMYDNVMGAFGGKYSTMFSVGGDESLKPADSKANRFKPVVKYLGPFTIKKGEKKVHAITLPAYVGSVRTMVVAGQNGAFGNAEKTTPVRSPLMILSSLPRVLSVNEEISLPVNVFVMENDVKDVSIKVETTGLLQAANGNSKSIHFTSPGDEIVYFPMKTGAVSGVEKVTVTATGGGRTSKETIEIKVRNPNPTAIVTERKTIAAGASETFNYRLTGASDDDWAKVEVLRIASFPIASRFDFLYDYGHYCSEQLTSRALPLLFIDLFKSLDANESNKIKKNITEGIKNLYGRQLSTGGIVYWPGNPYPDEWITSYAGSFLVMAKEKGYEVNEGVLNRWKAFQLRESRNWTPDKKYSDDFQQAYRLYTLALAGSPDLASMNQLKERKDLSQQARWSLAAAYAISGKIKPAEELIFNVSTIVNPYSDRYTYGSSDRDEAMILQTLVWMGRTSDAVKLSQSLAKRLSNQTSFTTQSTAFDLAAMGALAEKISGEINLAWTLNGKKQEDVKSTKAGYQFELPKKPSAGKVTLENNGKGELYVNLVTKSRPLIDTLPAMADGLKIAVRYVDLTGAPINETEIKQGSDFIAIVKVSNINPSADHVNLALTHIIPSGWEIFNERMTNDENNIAVSDKYTYRDIRDDRVLTYFDLPRGKSTEIKIRLQASYVGSFVLPAIQCEAMYDASVQARTVAGKVKVVK
ncbi:MAG: MG2 domain-containing protein [Candidatus Azobacteroides sp.]|nr:MG2 domain-containing protein [Candidatus Azobacteroides sp.]